MHDHPATAAPSLEEAMELRRQALSLWQQIYDFASRTEDALKASKVPVEDAVDIAYVLRSLENHADSARKDCKKRKEQIAKIVSLHVATLEMENPGKGEHSVKGRLAIGTPDVKREASLPKVGSVEYKMFMKTLGVPEDVIDMNIIKPDWNGVSDRATELARAGKPLPPGLGQTYVRHLLALRRRTDSRFGEEFKGESDNSSND